MRHIHNKDHFVAFYRDILIDTNVRQHENAKHAYNAVQNKRNDPVSCPSVFFVAQKIQQQRYTDQREDQEQKKRICKTD